MALTWTAQDITFNQNAARGVWVDWLNLFVIAGNSTDEKLISTSPDGEAWTAVSSNPWKGNVTAAQLYEVAASPTILVGVGTAGVGTAPATAGSAICSSTNGTSWTARAAVRGSGVGDVRCVAYSAEQGLWVAAGQDSVPIYTSTDGITWSNPSTYMDGGALYGICYSPDLDLWVGAGYDPTGEETAFTSPDGTTWTPRSTPLDDGFGTGFGVCWDTINAQFVMVGQPVDGTVSIATSPTGATWTGHSSAFDDLSSGNARSVALCGTVLVAVGAKDNFSTACVCESSNGATWTEDTTPLSAGVVQGGFGVCYSSELGVALIDGYTTGGTEPGAATAEVSTPVGSATNGIRIAFGQSAYAAVPVFTRIDSPFTSGLEHFPDAPFSGRFVHSWETHRGRAYELDKTEAGTAKITCFDTTGYFDPTNPNSPFYGEIEPNQRLKISALNPSNDFYYDQFAGFIESYAWTMDQAERMMTVTISANDGFELLSRGEIPPNASASGISSQDGVITFVGDAASTACQTRLHAILDLAEWPNGAAWRRLNTGNVRLQETKYNVQTSFLAAIQDVADAEFPGVANFFIDKSGRATFLGRYPRFKPTLYPEDIQFWQVGDKTAADTFGAAKISEIEWAIDSKNVINESLCYQYGIDPADIADQLVTAADFGNTSQTRFGHRTHTLPDLLNAGQNSSGSPDSGQPELAAGPATKLFATYFVQNYMEPSLRISKLVFKTRPVGDSQTWAFMTGVEIGDILTVFTRNPGGGGFSKQTDGMQISQFFVEGITNVVTVLSDIPDWTQTLDVSPRAWFPNNYPIGGTP